MEVFLSDWLNLALRWAHMIAGIGWIGTSFYFIGLDVSLRKRAGDKEGVLGSAWEVHGGGFYHIEKYAVAPKKMPGDLIWYKWEAYLTWVTGFALLAVQYYVHASTYLIDPGVADLAPWQAILISVASLVAGWLIYDGLCRSPLGRHTVALGLATFVLILAASYLFTQVFSGRGALIHVGAFIGTIMAVNVFMIIIPGQKKTAEALMRGEDPDPRYGAVAKQRSVHNTYLTLPVLLMMVSQHYPMLTGHPHSWLLVGLILMVGALVRHAFVRHEAGDALAKFVWAPGLAAVGFAAALVMTAPRTDPALAALEVSDAEAQEIVATHCTNCHSASPAHEGFDDPPKDIAFDSLDEIRRYGGLIEQQAVASDTMPLGNETGMTEEERKRLGAWLIKQRGE
jgi:uncharacterized membrane protein